jgi:hypothetical protein
MSIDRHEYPRDLHRVSRHARPSQLIEWVINTVEADGGKATFTGFGRNEKRILQRLEQDLPADYVTDLIRFEGDSPAANRRKQTREMRLYVRRRDQAGERIITNEMPQAELIERYGQELEAERQRLRHQHRDRPDTGNEA